MALDAFALRNMAVSLNDIDMASLTDNPSFNILSMIETPALDLNVPLRFNVTRSATTYGTGNAFLFPLWASLVVVTDETVDFVHGEVRSLDKLGMTRGASKLHPPSQFTQVFSVWKSHIFIDHVSLQILNLMASLLETTGIVNLRVRPIRCLSRDKIGQWDLAIHPFALQMIKKAGFVVAFRTCDMMMTGGSPRLYISIHLVTKAAEGGGLTKFEKSCQDDEKGNDAK
jgi:hypothetical protein